MPTALENISRGLRHASLDGLVTITKSEDDRVWGWPTGALVDGFSPLEKYCRDNDWLRDPKMVAEHHHGAGTRSYREPSGCHPAMQMCFHPSPAGDFVEIDFDYAAPVDVVGLFEHAGEVIQNSVSGNTTNQAKVAELLDKRFGKETANAD